MPNPRRSASSWLASHKSKSFDHFRRYVPTRFLSLVKDELEGRKDSDKDRLLAQLAQATRTGPLPARTGWTRTSS
jgi:hypothetical protein